MSKTVRKIAKSMGVKDADLVKEKQRIRDEFKRQGIKPMKEGNKFVVSDDEADQVINALRSNAKPSKSEMERKKLFQQIDKLKAHNQELENDKKSKDEEIRRLNSKIEKYADDFKELNDKQLQLNNQQQQLQARILEQTKQLKITQQQLLDNVEKNNKLQDKVDKVENASIWQRIIKKFD